MISNSNGVSTSSSRCPLRRCATIKIAVTATEASQPARLRLRRLAARRSNSRAATALTATAAAVAGMPSGSVIACTRPRSAGRSAPTRVSSPTIAANAEMTRGENETYPVRTRANAVGGADARSCCAVGSTMARLPRCGPADHDALSRIAAGTASRSGRAQQRHDDVVDDPLDVLVGYRQPLNDEPGQQHGGKYLGDKLVGGLRPHLPTRDAALQQAEQRFPLRAPHPRVEGGGKLGVATALGSHCAQGLPHPTPDQRAYAAADVHECVASGGRSRRRPHQVERFSRLRAESGDDEILLGGPAPINAGLAGVCAGGHRLDSESGVSDLGQLVDDSVVNRVLERFATAAVPDGISAHALSEIDWRRSHLCQTLRPECL